MPHHTSKTRVVLYRFDFDFNESEMERLLKQYKDAGIVSQYDTGRGHLVWFEGAPGSRMRDLRNQVAGMRDRARSKAEPSDG